MPIMLAAVWIFALLAQSSAGQVEASVSSENALDPCSVYDISLEELLHINVATGHEQDVAQAPAIVSVIHRDDIATYDCRTLADVLRLVSGFE